MLKIFLEWKSLAGKALFINFIATEPIKMVIDILYVLAFYLKRSNILISSNRTILFGAKIGSLALIGVFFWGLELQANNPKIDSLQALILTQTDSAKALSLCELSFQYYQKDDSIALDFAQQALELSRQLDFHRGESLAQIRIANIYTKTGNHQHAIDLYFQAYKLLEVRKDSIGLSYLLQSISRSYRSLGNYPFALKYALESLKLKKILNVNAANTLGSLGEIYLKLNEVEKSLSYYQECLALLEMSKEKDETFRYYRMKGKVLAIQQNFEESLIYFDSALIALDQVKHPDIFARIKYQKAVTLKKMKKLVEALPNILEAIEIRKNLNDKRLLLPSILLASSIYLDLSQYKKSIDYAQKGLSLSREFKEYRARVEILENLHHAYHLMKDFKQAYFYAYQYSLSKDSLLTQEKNRQLLILQLEYDLQQNERINKTLNLENELKEKKIRNQFYVILLVLSGMIFVLLYLYNLYKNHQQSKVNYHFLLKHVNDGLMVLINGKIQHYNEKAASILGCKKEEWIGQSIEELFAETNGNLGNLVEKWALHVKEAFNKGKAQFDWVIKGVEGNEKWVEVRLNLVVGSPEKRLLVLWRDISDRKKAEELIVRELREKNALINNTTDLIWSIDSEMRLRSFNAPYAKVIEAFTQRKLNPGDPVLNEEFGPVLVERWKKYYESALLGETFQTTEQVEIPDGTLYSEISFFPIKEENEIIGVSCFSKDITQRKVASLALGASEEKYRTQMERITDGFVSFDDAWNYTYVNAKAGELLGKDPEYLLGKNVFEEFPDQQGKVFHQALVAAKAEQQFLTIESYFPHLDKWFEDHIYPSSQGVSVFYQDVTKRKKAQLALQEREAHLSLIYKSIPQMVLLLRHEKKGEYFVESANENFLEMLRLRRPDIDEDILIGWPSAKFLGETILVNEWESYERSIERMDKTMESGEMYRFELNSFWGEKLLAYEITMTPIIQILGRPSHLLILIDDITAKLIEAEKTFIAINKALEEERTRIASELHDSLTQTLTVASINLKNLGYDILKVKNQQKYTQAVKFLEEGIEESRSLAHQIMPKSIRDFGLILAIEDLIEKNLQSHQIEIEFSCNRRRRLSAEYELNLFRIVQQSLTNALSHAQANHIFIKLDILQNKIHLLIKDDGIGFLTNESSPNLKGIGIHTMRSRAMQLGGALTIESQIGKGTEIFVNVPLIFELEEHET